MKLDLPVIQTQSSAVTRADLMAAFFSGRNERTVTAYRQDLEDFSAFTKAQTINAASLLLLTGTHGEANAMAMAYKASLVDRGLQASTVNRRLASLRSLVKLSRTLGMIPWTLEVENLKAEAYRDTTGPGKQGFQRLIREVSRKQTKKAVRDRAVLHLLYDLGLRRGEAVSLNLDDWDGHILSVLGKGRTQKTRLTIPEPTFLALKDWLLVRGSMPGPLFFNMDRAKKGDGRISGTSVYRLVRALGEHIGIKARPHGLRHAAVTEACKLAQENGIKLEEVLDFSRHKDVKTLMVYRDRERNVQGQLAALVAEAGVSRREQ